jgi:hypothetical protein
LLAPVVVASTLVVFCSGVVLLFMGPAHREPLLLIHKASFVVWLGATALRVLGHVIELPEQLRLTDADRHRLGVTTPGRPDRIVLLGAAVGVGLLLALLLSSEFSIWTAHAAFHSAG